MSIPESVMITVNTRRHIPFINKLGPITIPIAVYESVASDLKKLGYPVEIHDSVGIDEHGNRYITNPKDFVKLPEGEVISPSESENSNVQVPVSDTLTNVPHDEHTSVENSHVEESETTSEKTAVDEAATKESSEEPVAEQSETTTEEPATDETPVEEAELVLQSYDVYSAMSVKKLRAFLTTDAADYIEDDVLAKVPSMEKKDALEIIKSLIDQSA